MRNLQVHLGIGGKVMKKIAIGFVVGAFALISGIAFGASAQAAAPSTLVISGGNGVYGLDPVTIVGTANNAGAVSFSVNGVIIKGCEIVPTTTIAPFVAKCAWLPASAGSTLYSGTFTPADTNAFSAVTGNQLAVKIGVPVQGVVDPIHIYVDTVLATGSTGALAPRFGQGCTISSEFIVGQTIVFRVYANNAEQGGGVMDTSNTAKAYIEIAGVKDPITLNYGNHSGVAFWTGVLKTGSTAPAYGTLGVINYKVTMIAKDMSTMKVLSSKLVSRKAADGSRVLVDGKFVYDRVPYYRTIKVTPALKGAVGVWQSNFATSSQLTLYAVPKA